MTRTSFSTLPGSRLAAGLFLASLLAGCANLADTPAGTPFDEVQAKFGSPDFSCTTQEGQKRVIWSMQPLGQYAWGTHVDDQGNVDEVVPILTTENFRKLDEGTWDADQVRCEYGPPAETGPVGLPSVRQEVWSYRFKENGAWNSLMHVYFDPETGEVTRHHAGPDPLYERERFLFW